MKESVIQGSKPEAETPEAAEPWSLTSLREKLIMIGAKVVSHGVLRSTLPGQRSKALGSGSWQTLAHWDVRLHHRSGDRWI